MPTARVTRRVHFSAGHRLHNPEFGDDLNRRTYGLCNNPSGHGHNYDLEVTVEGEVDPRTGYVMDLKRLKELLGAAVLTDLDHANLNVDVPWLEGIIPTASTTRSAGTVISSPQVSQSLSVTRRGGSLRPAPGAASTTGGSSP